jgi:signal transduction histidine kinase
MLRTEPLPGVRQPFHWLCRLVMHFSASPAIVSGLNELAELQRRFERLNLLYEVSTAIHSTLDPQEALQIIVREAVRLARASSGSLVLLNPTNGFLEVQAAVGLPPNSLALRLRPAEGITGWVARTGKPACVGNVHADPRYFMIRPEVRSELAVPIEVSDEVRGALNVDSAGENAFQKDDQQLLEMLAVHAVKAIQNTWLYEQLRLKAGLFESLAHVSRTINSTLNLDEALQAITREACPLMKAKMASLLLLDEAGKWLDLRASHGAGEAYIGKPRLSVAETFLGTVVRRKKPFQLENVQVSGRYQNAAVAREEGLVSLLAVPLVFAEQAIGALNVYTGEPRSFSNEEIRILSALAELSAVAIQKARLHERIVEAEEQLRQSERLSALGLLAAEVAHEIRNPLTVMKMMFHSLDLQFGPEDPRRRDAEIMADKMEHLNQIVEQVLNFARSTEPAPACVDINEILDKLALLVRHKVQQQRIELKCELAADLPPVMADARQLEQAFLNLILNAIEAMTAGGNLTIRSTTACLPGSSSTATHVAIAFRDTGPGMKTAQRRQAFSSLLSTTKRSGTGLGLAIVHRVVETHRGQLKLQSRPGHGTTITILLPL